MLRKHSKRIWFLAAITLLLVIALGACTQTDTDNTADDLEVDTTEDEAAVAEDEPEEVIVEEEAPPTPEATMGEEAEADEDSVIVYAAPSDIRTLEPQFTNNRLDTSIILHLFDVLGYRDRNGVTQPQLAESWTQIDSTTWEFKLREGVTCHNGEELTSEDVAFSMERARTPEFNNFYQLPAQTNLKEVEIIDDYTFRFITEEPAPTMEFWLAEAPILPMDYYDSHTIDEVAEAPVGCGPYKFVEWVRDDHVTLEANPDYWQGEPDVDTLIFRVIPEESQRLNELRAGNVDVAPQVSIDQAELADSDVSRLHVQEGLRKMNYQISQTGLQPALEDKRVRQALNYAIDVDAIIDGLFQGYTTRLTSYVNPPNDNPDLVPYRYDPELAQELLEQAGYPDGFDLVIQARRNNYGFDEETVLLTEEYLEAIGIDVEVEFMESGLFVDALDNKEFKGLAFIGWAALVNPLVENLILTCDHIDNGSQYCNEEFDALYEQALTTTDEAEREEILMAMQEIAWEDAPWVFLWKLPVLHGISNRVEWEPRNDGYIDLWNASVVSQ